MQSLGYTQVSLLEGGLDGWRKAGGELFIDVNVPSKAFGELVESQRHTPSLAAEEVQALLDSNADVVVLDARRFDEYQTMSEVLVLDRIGFGLLAQNLLHQTEHVLLHKWLLNKVVLPRACVSWLRHCGSRCSRPSALCVPD